MKDFVWETTTEGKDSSISTDQIGFLEGGFKGSEETSFMETLSYIIDDVVDKKVTRRKNEDGKEEIGTSSKKKNPVLTMYHLVIPFIGKVRSLSLLRIHTSLQV